MRTKKQKQKEMQREQNRRIREAAMALHAACREVGCQNCEYNNYDGKGHCKLSAFDKADIEYRPSDWNDLDRRIIV